MEDSRREGRSRTSNRSSMRDWTSDRGGTGGRAGLRGDEQARTSISGGEQSTTTFQRNMVVDVAVSRLRAKGTRHRGGRGSDRHAYILVLWHGHTSERGTKQVVCGWVGTAYACSERPVWNVPILVTPCTTIACITHATGDTCSHCSIMLRCARPPRQCWDSMCLVARGFITQTMPKIYRKI